MSNYSFIRTPEEINEAKHPIGVYERRKTITLRWLIKQELYDRLLPPGLEPADEPVVFAFVSAFTHCGFGLPAYNEGGLFLCCKHNGVGGVICLSMPIQGVDEMGIMVGREMYGYPKKPAKVQLSVIGEKVHAVIGRHGIDYFELEGTLGEAYDTFTPFPKEYYGYDYTTHVFLLDHKIDPAVTDLNKFEINFKDIKLYDQQNIERTLSEVPMKVNLTFRESPDDPWIELKPEKILSANFIDNYCDMRGNFLLKEYKTPEEIQAITPYLFWRYDCSVWNVRHEIFL